MSKKTKTEEEIVDIRPLIYDWGLEEGLFLRLSAGSAANLKPDTVMEAWNAFSQKEGQAAEAGHSEGGTQSFPYHFHRLELYARREGQLIPLYALGEEIKEESAE